jgi:hypothetical protein
MAELCVAGTVVNQIHADLKSEKSERGGADKEDRRRVLNFPDIKVTPPPPPASHSSQKSWASGSAFKWLSWLCISTVSPTVLGTRNRIRIRIQNRQNWQKCIK